MLFFVMYYIYVTSGSSLLIESTDSMIISMCDTMSLHYTAAESVSVSSEDERGTGKGAVENGSKDASEYYKPSTKFGGCVRYMCLL